MTLFGALALLFLGVVIGPPARRWMARAAGGNWRPGAGVLGLACLAAALFSGVRGAGVVAAVLAIVGLLLVFAARQRGVFPFGLNARRVRPGPSPGSGQTPGQAPGQAAGSATGMSRTDAAAILGVPTDADAKTVQDAYLRQIRRAHPDAGGTPGLAAQLNRAREVMTGRT